MVGPSILVETHYCCTHMATQLVVVTTARKGWGIKRDTMTDTLLRLNPALIQHACMYIPGEPAE